jgi:hypothetical protein
VIGAEPCSARMFLVSCPNKDVLNCAHHSAEYFGTIPPLTHLSVASLLWNLHGFAGTWNPSGDLTFFATDLQNAGLQVDSFFDRPRGNSPVVLLNFALNGAARTISAIVRWRYVFPCGGSRGVRLSPYLQKGEARPPKREGAVQPPVCPHAHFLLSSL